VATHARFAVLDLGSTTFQLLVADADAEGSLTPVLRDRLVLNLGRVLAGKGRIPDEVAERAAGTARRLTDFAVRTGADHVVPIATSALRDSPDREALESLFEGAIGTPVRFIDGREEARLTFAGVTASVALGEGTTLLLDLGGGSLEVALADPEGLRWGRSLPIGAGRMTGLLVGHDPPTREERKAVRAAVEDAVAPVVEDVALAEPARCIASGGTAGALARVIAARRWSTPPASLNQYEVTVSGLRELTRELAGIPLAERLRVPGVDERRAELLPAGGWILTAAAVAFGAKRLVHSEWGLREGVVLDALGLADRPAPPPDELRRLSVDRLVRGWGEDRSHVELVARIAHRLFDDTAALHGLGASDRELLGHGASLHEIGARISPARLHKHGAYLVENAGLRGFSPDEVAMIASLVRFHRGKDPRSVYPPFAALSAAEQESVVVLVGLLRLAHAIARGPEGERLEVGVASRRGGLRVLISGSENPDAVIMEARLAAELLARTLESRIEIGAGDAGPDKGRRAGAEALPLERR
jgi:exopolyphosphatase / guanosine-5'-triphosphate,3'-diphosphate pyrophosphatase